MTDARKEIRRNDLGCAPRSFEPSRDHDPEWLNRTEPFSARAGCVEAHVRRPMSRIMESVGPRWYSGLLDCFRIVGLVASGLAKSASGFSASVARCLRMAHMQIIAAVALGMRMGTSCSRVIRYFKIELVR